MSGENGLGTENDTTWAQSKGEDGGGAAGAGAGDGQFGSWGLAEAQGDHPFTSWSPGSGYNDKHPGDEPKPFDWSKAFSFPPDSAQFKPVHMHVDFRPPPAPPHHFTRGGSRDHSPGPDMNRIADEAEAAERGVWWGAIYTDVLTVESTWNAIIPQAQAFEHAQNDKTLDDEFFKIPSGASGSLDKLAGEQHPVRTGETKLGDIFSSGGPLNAIVDEREAIERAGTTGPVNKKEYERRQLDHELAAALENVLDAKEGMKAAGSGVDIAYTRIEIAKDEKNVAGAQEELRRIKESKELAAHIFSGLYEFVGHAGAGVFAMLHDAAGHSTSGEQSEQLGDALGIASEGLMGIVFHSKIAAAEEKLEEAQRELGKAKNLLNTQELAQALARQQQAVHTLKTAQELVKAKVIQRRQVYSSLGQTVANNSGLEGSSKQRVQAMIAAVPTVELVIARARGIVDSAALPAYTPDSGKGYTLATESHHDFPDVFSVYVGLLNGIKSKYGRVANEWEGKLRSLQQLIKSLESAAG